VDVEGGYEGVGEIHMHSISRGWPFRFELYIFSRWIRVCVHSTLSCVDNTYATLTTRYTLHILHYNMSSVYFWYWWQNQMW